MVSSLVILPKPGIQQQSSTQEVTKFGVDHSGQPAGLGSLALCCAGLSSGTVLLGYAFWKEDHVTMLFLVSLIFTRMAYEGFQEMSMFLQQKVSSVFNVLDHYNTMVQIK